MKRFFKYSLIDILWLVFSIPLFTIGASSCAAIYVTRKMVDDEEFDICKSFIKAFKDNFKQGTILSFFTTFCCAVAGVAWYFTVKNDFNKFAVIGCLFLSLIVFFLNLYAYPMVARYNNDLKSIIRNSFIISLQFLKKTIVIIVIINAEFMMCIWQKWTIILGILFMPEVSIYTLVRLSKDVFTNIENHKTDEEYAAIEAEEAAKAAEESEESEEETETENSEESSDEEESEE